MVQGIGVTSLLTLISHFFFILITFRLLFAVRFDRLLKANHVRDGQLLIVFLAIAIGYNVSEFFISFMTSAINLPNILH